jgi:hypothetical protein
MDTNLFTERSLWTMIHGIVLSGAALMALSAALFSLHTIRAGNASETVARIQSRYLVGLTVFTAVILWLTVLVGTYVVFPPYRAVPPEGVTDFRLYPKALIQANPGTAWLHSFAMETKEHVPWISAMLATAVAFVSLRYRSQMLSDARLNKLATLLLAICLLLVAYAALLGVFVNKVAPLE